MRNISRTVTTTEVRNLEGFVNIRTRVYGYRTFTGNKTINIHAPINGNVTIFFHNDIGMIADSAMYMFGIGAAWGNTGVLYALLRWMPFLILGVVACTPYPKRWIQSLRERYSAAEAASPFVLALLLLLSVAYMVNDTFSPFLYYIF